MKNLFNFILPGILVLSLTSCSKYYINTVSSNQMSKNKSTGEFMLENDSVTISYGFAGQDAPVHVKVYNKLGVPLFVDWSKSSVIYNGRAKGFIPDEIKFSGSISTSGSLRPFYSHESTVEGTVQAQKQTTFIPPNSGIETIIKAFDADAFRVFSDSLYKENDYLSSSQGSVKVQAGHFDYENSPLAFRTYLTLFTQDGQQIHPFAFDKGFYVSKSIKTSGRPQNFMEYSSLSPDVFYIATWESQNGKNTINTADGATSVGVAAVQPK